MNPKDIPGSLRGGQTQDWAGSASGVPPRGCHGKRLSTDCKSLFDHLKNYARAATPASQFKPSPARYWTRLRRFDSRAIYVRRRAKFRNPGPLRFKKRFNLLISTKKQACQGVGYTRSICVKISPRGLRLCGGTADVSARKCGTLLFGTLRRRALPIHAWPMKSRRMHCLPVSQKGTGRRSPRFTIVSLHTCWASSGTSSQTGKRARKCWRRFS
jgi:hypothetical protein